MIIEQLQDSFMDGAQYSELLPIPVHASSLTARVLSSVADIDRAQWDRLHDDDCRGFDYCRACELSGDTEFSLFAVGVFADGFLVAGSPVFSTRIPHEMLLEGTARKLVSVVGKRWPNVFSVPVVAIGSPYRDDSGLVFDARLDAKGRERALRLMFEALDAWGKPKGISTILAKDVTDKQHATYGAVFADAGFSAIQGLPVTSLPVPETDEAYIHSLSANMRSNMRRKLKKAKGLRLEVRTSVDDELEDVLHSMRAATTARAKIDFEAFSQVPRGYYRAILTQMAGNAHLRLYWFEERLIGFALVLSGPRQVTETFTGMLYPEGPDHGLFFYNWMVHIAEARAKGMREIDPGPTTYIAKQRLNCTFHRSWLYVRDRKPLANWIIGKIAPGMGFDKSDPDLIALGDQAPYA